jgi:cystathionine gamma-synthase
MTLDNFSLADTQQLGSRLPNDPHAVSAALPAWQDVVDYEEGKQRVSNALHTAYPRFMFHPLVSALAESLRTEFAIGDGYLTLYPSYDTAKDALAFIHHATTAHAELIVDTQKNIYVCCTGKDGAAAAKAHWQHTGLGISSRHAERALRSQVAADADYQKHAVRAMISKGAGVAEDDVTLHPTGMSALYCAYRITRKKTGHTDTVQLGFPYVDTLKIQQKWGGDVHMLDNQGAYIAQLESLFAQYPIAACFTEFPSNPLLKPIDIQALSECCRAYGVLLIVDDTIATWFNCDLRHYADITCTSLTKGFSGKGNVMAGACIVQPHSPYAAELRAVRDALYEDIFHADDARVLAANMIGFEARMQRMNANAAELVQYLAAHHDVADVYYPSHDKALYDKVKTPHGGYGCLLSFTLKNASHTPAFYDALQVCKGPSLGTEFTLCCPYTLLAHYYELDWAKSYGVDAHLLRVSVGCEDISEIITRFEKAFAQAR